MSPARAMALSRRALVALVAAVALTTTCTAAQLPSSGSGVVGPVPPAIPAEELVEGVPGPRPGVLTTVQVDPQAMEDLVVFEFSGELPGYRVLYADEPVLEDTSGAPANLSGQVALLVELSPGPRVIRGYDGPIRIPVARAESVAGTVEDVALVDGTGGAATWALGLRERVPFTVLTEEDPARLIVSLSHND